MSAQAMGWALQQEIPSRAKLLLVALGNYADHRSGHCWPSVEILMEETSMSRRAVFGYLGALRRNGYIEIRAAIGKDGRQRSNDYWILFDRVAAPWQHNKQQKQQEDAEDVEESSISEEMPDRPEIDQDTKYAPLATIPAPPLSNSCTPIYEPSDSNRQNLELKDRRAPRIEPPKEFSSQRRLEQKASLQAAEEARKPKYVNIIEGSKPWEAHVRAGHPKTLVCNVLIDGKMHRGWSFLGSECNGLYPKPKQQSTGPPLSELMTSEDEEHFRFK